MAMHALANEKRHFSRIPFDACVRVSSGGAAWESQLLDVSLRGVLIRRPDDWHPAIGQPFDLRITLNGDLEAVIQMQTAASHEGPACIGFTCEHIDLDSMTHLRRLVELNLGEPDLLDRELEALVGSQRMRT